MKHEGDVTPNSNTKGNDNNDDDDDNNKPKEIHYIYEPNVNDVLCVQDRHRRWIRHTGNILYQSEIRKNAMDYNQGDKKTKMLVTKKIVSYMEKEYNSRFLRLVVDDKTNKQDAWEIIPEKLARDKISHALRNALKYVAPDTSTTTTITTTATISATTTSGIVAIGEISPIPKKRIKVSEKHKLVRKKLPPTNELSSTPINTIVPLGDDGSVLTPLHGYGASTLTSIPIVTPIQDRTISSTFSTGNLGYDGGIGSSERMMKSTTDCSPPRPPLATNKSFDSHSTNINNLREHVSIADASANRLAEISVIADQNDTSPSLTRNVDMKHHEGQDHSNGSQMSISADACFGVRVKSVSTIDSNSTFRNSWGTLQSDKSNETMNLSGNSVNRFDLTTNGSQIFENNDLRKIFAETKDRRKHKNNNNESKQSHDEVASVGSISDMESVIITFSHLRYDGTPMRSADDLSIHLSEISLASGSSKKSGPMRSSDDLSNQLSPDVCLAFGSSKKSDPMRSSDDLSSQLSEVPLVFGSSNKSGPMGSSADFSSPLSGSNRKSGNFSMMLTPVAEEIYTTEPDGDVADQKPERTILRMGGTINLETLDDSADEKTNSFDSEDKSP